MNIYNKIELMNYINSKLKPNEKSKRERGEVFTPLTLVNEMLDKLPKEVWTNPDLKWLDPAVGIGNFPIIVYFRLMDGLKDIITDEEERRRHILEDMIYMVEIDETNANIVKDIFDNNTYKLNIFEGDSLKYITDDDFYDIIIGNPPFNKPSNDSPYYNEFIEYFENKCNLLMFVVPSRWFAGGKGLKKFRKKMLNKTDIEFIYHFDDAKKLFGNTIELKGGINFFLINKKYNGKCKIVNNLNEFNIFLNKHDILIPNVKYYELINKLNKYTSLSTIYLGRYFNIESNDKNLIDTKTNKDFIKCYVSQQKGFIKYINKKEIKKEINIWKVITPSASGNGCDGFGKLFIGKQNEVHTGSFISFKINTEKEAESLLSYLKCKLPNFMLSLRKITKQINNETCKWIPLPPLDRIWNDEGVYKYYKISRGEIE